MKEIWTVPRKLPKDGTFIVHNRVRARGVDPPLRIDGFRAWIATKEELAHLPVKLCDCGWSGLPHYRCGLWGKVFN